MQSGGNVLVASGALWKGKSFIMDHGANVIEDIVFGWWSIKCVEEKY